MDKTKTKIRAENTISNPKNGGNKRINRRKLRKSSQVINTTPPKRAKFAVCGNFAVYLTALLLAVLFTQALRSSLSAVLLVFLLLLPAASIVYMLTAFYFVGASSEKDGGEIIKGAPVGFAVTISNGSLLAYPFVEADITTPGDSAVRCSVRRVWLSLSPGGSYQLRRRITFKYRGSYEIGVSDIYVYDIFRMFRIKITAGAFSTIIVLPRRLTLGGGTASAPSDMNTDSSKNVVGVDRSELADIRDYRAGDHMKTIHWQLYSKMQELVVKEFEMNSGRTVYIIADLAAVSKNGELDSLDTGGRDLTDAKDSYFAGNISHDEDLNEYMADGVVELAIAATLRELNGGNSCTLMWHDERAAGGVQVFPMQNAADFGGVFHSFATAPVASQDARAALLASLIEETQAVTVVFVTAMIDGKFVSELDGAVASLGGVAARGAIEIRFFNPAAKISPESKKRFDDMLSDCRRRIEHAGIPVLDELPK